MTIETYLAEQSRRPKPDHYVIFVDGKLFMEFPNKVSALTVSAEGKRAVMEEQPDWQTFEIWMLFDPKIKVDKSHRARWPRIEKYERIYKELANAFPNLV